MINSESKVLVAQLGARMHYAVPRLLHRASVLSCLCTDFYIPSSRSRWLGGVPKLVQPGGLRRLLGRDPGDIPPERIKAFNYFGLTYALRLMCSKSESDRTRAFLWAGREFCRKIIDNGFGDATGIYAYNSAALELLQAAKQQGLTRTLEQTIAPRQVECELISKEAERFPAWKDESCVDSYWKVFADREAAEWEVAEVILCGSEFVREGIRVSHGPAEKCVVVPYGVDCALGTPFNGVKARDAGCPLKVLTVGAVGLRKGSPYVLESAKRLKGLASFRMVGRVEAGPRVRAELSQFVELVGTVPRAEVARHFLWADVLLLPSICEGSATVTYEALGYGLPVICTRNTGSVVQDGIEGFIVPAGETDMIVARLLLMRNQVDRWMHMSLNARRRSQEYTLPHYGERLLASFR
ncbi:MAG TPA: glycosyltransferase family 4 protein [Clostridia bacterium]|nr:glycosyltransferase family 4 protein [Clostridia bacterium]